MSSKIQETKCKFREKADDLLRSNGHTIENAISIFLGFCESDEIMAVLTQPLKRNTNTVVTGWFDSFSEGAIKEFRLPTNDDDRLALKNESAHYSVSARIGLTYVGGYRSDDLVNRAPYPSEASEQPEPMSSPQYLFDSRPRL